MTITKRARMPALQLMVLRSADKTQKKKNVMPNFRCHYVPGGMYFSRQIWTTVQRITSPAISANFGWPTVKRCGICRLKPWPSAFCPTTSIALCACPNMTVIFHGAFKIWKSTSANGYPKESAHPIRPNPISGKAAFGKAVSGNMPSETSGIWKTIFITFITTLWSTVIPRKCATGLILRFIMTWL